MRTAKGFTLLELLAVLLVLALLASFAGPAWRELSAKVRADSAMFQLRALLGLARDTAITAGRDITVCGTLDGRQCSAQWDAQPALLFDDANRNRRLDAGERLVLLSDRTLRSRIRWRASGNRAYLRYRPDGGVGEFGHFLYCPEDRDPRFARQLIVSAQGRPRHARDSNGDGIAEDRSGAPLSCPP